MGIGTLVVTLLYIGVNAAFMRTTPIPEMVGKQQVALVAGTHIFGEAGGRIMALFICLGLISTVSAMMWIGPRVTVAMGEDLRMLSWLARRNSRGIPVNATLTQFVVVNVMLLTATFQTVVNYVQFALTRLHHARRWPACSCCAGAGLICRGLIKSGATRSRRSFF